VSLRRKIFYDSRYKVLRVSSNPRVQVPTILNHPNYPGDLVSRKSHRRSLDTVAESFRIFGKIALGHLRTTVFCDYFNYGIDRYSRVKPVQE
jgi:hypothetical protein